MLPPLPRVQQMGVVLARNSPIRVSLPRKGCRVGLHIVLFEACSAFTRVAACTLARSPIRDPLPEGFRHFVASMPAPVASGWSESPGGACTHWKAPPCHGAHPDQTFPQLYGCGSEFNRNNYCNPEVEELIARQSSEADQEKRKQLVWQIERKLAEDDARPIIFYSRDGTCSHPRVKGLTLMVNSIFNGWRMEDVWLDN